MDEGKVIVIAGRVVVIVGATPEDAQSILDGIPIDTESVDPTVISVPSSDGSISTDSPDDTAHAPSGSEAGDIATLEALYSSANGGTWKHNGGWGLEMSLDSPPFGVKVETIDGQNRVTKIDLRANNLTGSIDIPEWENLTELRYLNVHQNALDSAFPSALAFPGNKLQYLYLSFSDHVVDVSIKDPHQEAQDFGRVHSGKTPAAEKNNFTGELPPTIGNLTNLEWFTCCWGSLTGTIPTDLYMPQLRGLWLMGNKYFTEHPMPDEIGNMSSITNLAIGNTAENGGRYDRSVFSAWNPNLSKLTNMVDLRFEYNRTGGEFPDLSGWTKAQSIDISRCGIDGTPFPSYLLDGTMPELVAFLANWPEGWWPDGAGFTGAIPEVDPSMAGMFTFSVAGQNIGGLLPDSFLKVLGPSLIIVELEETDIEGLSDADFSAMPNIRTYSI